MKSICIITSKYPTKYNPTALVFVQQLVWSFADMGIKCIVICPIAVNIDIVSGMKLPNTIKEITNKGSEITIYYPKYIGFGQKNIGFTNTASLTLESFTKAVREIFRILPEKPEVLYGHFISPAGVVAARLGRDFSIPAFLAYGESAPWSINNLGLDKVKEELKTLSGVVSVSTKNKNELIDLGIAEAEDIEVFPNAIRGERFYPRDKIESRKKFGLPYDAFIIAFVGHFIERKGIDKVINAVNGLDDVYAIYAGKGPISPASNKTLYCGLVNPKDLPWFYSAADVFVLPTENEGCCNAIIEAMACGLPIVSSNREFNYDVLCKDNAILIEPVVKEIGSAVLTLRNNYERRKILSRAVLEAAKLLQYDQRARNITNWISNKLSGYNQRMILK